MVVFLGLANDANTQELKKKTEQHLDLHVSMIFKQY